MSGTILTRHPQGKSGRSISREKYDQLVAEWLARLGGKSSRLKVTISSQPATTAAART